METDCQSCMKVYSQREEYQSACCVILCYDASVAVISRHEPVTCVVHWSKRSKHKKKVLSYWLGNVLLCGAVKFPTSWIIVNSLRLLSYICFSYLFSPRVFSHLVCLEQSFQNQQRFFSPRVGQDCQEREVFARFQSNPGVVCLYWTKWTNHQSALLVASSLFLSVREVH